MSYMYYYNYTIIMCITQTQLKLCDVAQRAEQIDPVELLCEWLPGNINLEEHDTNAFDVHKQITNNRPAHNYKHFCIGAQPQMSLKTDTLVPYYTMLKTIEEANIDWFIFHFHIKMILKWHM